MKFYLGTHKPYWLPLTDAPLFVSNRTLSIRKTLPEALAGWALDSGGFSELSLFGEWRTSASEYVALVRRYASEIGKLEWAASQDWMCEAKILNRTGKTVLDHQTLTIDNFLELKSLAPELPFVPVIQGFTRDDYFRHVDQYDLRGVRLKDFSLVGLGSICRRQSTKPIHALVRQLSEDGLKLHGFGVKKQGLAVLRNHLASADSMAWSYGARYEPAMVGHTHKTCSNCLEFAEAWRVRLLESIEEPELPLFRKQ